MTTDELRAAAKRLHRHFSSVSFSRDMPQLDAKALADAVVSGQLIFAADPADDGEAVTTDWLRAVGFYPDDPALPNRRLRTRCGLHITEYGGGWSLRDCLTVNVVLLSTRGHVRRLCAALGVPLTEGVPGA
jgi:hypothetical protein